MTLPITIVLSVKNEESNIQACIRSVGASFADIVVVDSNSDDDTVSLAAELGARIVEFTWDGRYPKKKQWILDNVPFSTDWILFVDGDERITRDLQDELVELFETQEGVSGISAFDIPILYFWRGRALRNGYVVHKRALLKRTEVKFPVIDDLELSGMGELEGHYQPVAQRGVQRLSSRLTHDDRDGFAAWVRRHNNYSDWEAGLRADESKFQSVARVRSKEGQRFARVPGKPVLFFVYAFIYRRGFKDGLEGLEYALCLAFYYFMIEIKTRERCHQ